MVKAKHTTKRAQPKDSRGQTFETMMLVISVIVAIAILGVLMGFLSGVSFGAKDAKAVIPQLFAKVFQAGYGVEFEKNVEFKQGAIILKRDAIGQSAVSDANVDFSCAESTDALCNSGGPIVLATDKIGPVNSKVTGVVAVCTNGQKYHVVVGTDPGKTTSTCTTKIQSP